MCNDLSQNPSQFVITQVIMSFSISLSLDDFQLKGVVTQLVMLLRVLSALRVCVCICVCVCVFE